ncbi:MAG: hypothetical protein RR278_07285, partial [Mucinivorans sp.]
QSPAAVIHGILPCLQAPNPRLGGGLTNATKKQNLARIYPARFCVLGRKVFSKISPLAALSPSIVVQNPIAIIG